MDSDLYTVDRLAEPITSNGVRAKVRNVEFIIQTELLIDYSFYFYL